MQCEHGIIPTVSQLNTNLTERKRVNNDEYPFNFLSKLVVIIEVGQSGDEI